MAVKLIWGATAISAAVTVVMAVRMIPGRSNGIALVLALFVALGLCFVALFWLGLKLRQGKSWARTVYVVLVVLSLLSVHDLPESFDESLASGLASLGSYLLLAITAALLLLPSANQWFRESASDNRVA